MLIASGLAVAMKPTKRIADEGPKLDLETTIPRNFGDWKLDTSIAPVKPSPEVQATLDKIYSQTLSRTYVNDRSERIMLSVAYGGDQSDAMQVHKPEICYPAQGFAILSNLKATLTTPFGDVPIRRLIAVQGARVEPITYWITVGNRTAVTGWEQKLAQLSYGFTGRVPDGMLIRVSSIDRDDSRAYRQQANFVRALLEHLDDSQRTRLIGQPGA